jgi:hypothetical protein
MVAICTDKKLGPWPPFAERDVPSAKGFALFPLEHLFAMARPPQFSRDPNLTRDLTAVKATVKYLSEPDAPNCWHGC